MSGEKHLERISDIDVGGKKAREQLEEPLHALYGDDEIDVVADRIVASGRRFKVDVLRGRMPVVRSRLIEQLEETGQGLVARMEEGRTTGSGMPDSCACLATTDVHEYGKIRLR